MKKWSLRLTVVAILIYGVAFAYDVTQPTKTAQPAPQKPKTVVLQPPTVDELLKLVNEERAKVGVKPLRLDPLLNKSAQFKAQDMLDYDYFDHVRNGKHGYEYVAEAGKVCISPSENIYKQTPIATSNHAVEWWMNSKPHREAMMNSRYESVGFGITNDQIVVQHFCDEN